MVRPFLRTPRTRALAACAALLTAGTASIAVPAAYGDDLHHRKNKVHTKVRHAQGDLQESSRELAAANRKLQRSRAVLAAAQQRFGAAERKLGAAEKYDAKMQARLTEAEHQLALARERLDAAKAAVIEMRRRIGELAASNYANGDPALMGLAVMLNSQDPDEVTSQMNTVDSLMNRQDTELTDLRAARAQLAEQATQVKEMTRQVAAQRKAAAVRVVETQELRRKALAAKREVRDLVTRNRAVEAKAAEIRRRDARKLQELQRQEQRIKQLILARARRQAQRHSGGGYTGSPGGLLSRPVPGYVTSPYGWREHPIYHYWGLHDGTDFSAPCGTALHAAASGTVISRYWSDVYGNRLYVDVGRVNGHSLTLVYNHASSYRVGVGSHVSRGETLGWAGSTGWSTGCHLHFTVLRDGSPTNPMNYM